jgi:hypothetical protein
MKSSVLNDSPPVNDSTSLFLFSFHLITFSLIVQSLTGIK